MRDVFTMPADLDQLARMANYPGMIPSESRPLRAFIARHGHTFNEIRFNVRLGQGTAAPADSSPELQRGWQQLTKMRVDALGWNTPNIATLIEAKFDLSNDGVWQLQSYRDHYLQEFADHQVRLVIVAEFASVTARALAESAGIALYLYNFTSTQPDVLDNGSEASPDDLR